MKKSEVFKVEISMIKDKDLAQAIENFTGCFPDDFFLKPASSTYKYHPTLSNGKHGLLMHTKFAFWIAVALMKKLDSIYSFTEEEQDIILASLIIHDSMKYGTDGGAKNRGYTYFEHPILVRKLFEEANPVVPDSVKPLFEKVLENTECHMGSWSTSRYSKHVLPVPDNKVKWFIHMCDVISGIEFCHFDFKEVKRFMENNFKDRVSK